MRLPRLCWPYRTLLGPRKLSAPISNDSTSFCTDALSRTAQWKGHAARGVQHAKRGFADHAFASEKTETGSRNEPRGVKGPKTQEIPTDHRDLGNQLSLFTGHPSSPGSPFFHPDGAHIFLKLQSFLRAQYPLFGIREVITPNLYKKELWQQSGHWDNYKDAMFAVKGRSGARDGEDPNYSLKPMNCPGHCLLYKSQIHSFRELPIRYADFSPLHRDEVSGSLSGLTRVRRFHQDDGHIFCRPEQVEAEIKSTLKFVDLIYDTLDLGSYKLVLSTRPDKDYIGTLEKWDTAERQLKEALDESGRPWGLNNGDGAFYGPKIDIILQDSDGKEHQTATIQLDFQLPQRFELQYDITAEEQGTPVLIHRAVLGSLERFMALLIEKYRGRWPFWLSPRPMIILTVGNDPEVVEYAEKARQMLSMPMSDLGGAYSPSKAYPASALTYLVASDYRSETLPKKVANAKARYYNLICVIGRENIKAQDITVDITGQPRQAEILDVFTQCNNNETVSADQKTYKSPHKISISQQGLQRAMELLSTKYL